KGSTRGQQAQARHLPRLNQGDRALRASDGLAQLDARRRQIEEDGELSAGRGDAPGAHWCRVARVPQRTKQITDLALMVALAHEHEGRGRIDLVERAAKRGEPRALAR